MLNRLGICAADGKSLSHLNEDCIAEGNVCTLDARCLKLVTDMVGKGQVGEMSSADTLVANVITIRAPRRLLELQTYIQASSAPRQLRWLVYEQVGNAFLAKVDVAVTAKFSLDNGVADVDSYPLQVGKTYLIGWVLSAGEITLGTSTSNLENLSFGVVVGRLTVPYAPSIDIKAMDAVQTDLVSFMRVGTVLP